MFARHRRFLLSFAAGLVLGLCAWAAGLAAERAALLAADGFFAIYLGLMTHFAQGLTPAALRQHAALSDEGVPMIAALALGSVGLSLTAIGHELAQATGAQPLLAVASVPLGWAMLHVLAAFHYAALWYEDAGGADARGLAFPGGGEPGPGEFLYFSFTIGMTAQVSDVVVESPGLRRVVLAHSVVSFFYNTVILALAVNAVVG